MNTGEQCSNPANGGRGMCHGHYGRVRRGNADLGAPLRHGGHNKTGPATRCNLDELDRRLHTFVEEYEYTKRTWASYEREARRFCEWTTSVHEVADPFGPDLTAFAASYLEAEREAGVPRATRDVIYAAIRATAMRRGVRLDEEELADYRAGAARFPGDEPDPEQPVAASPVDLPEVRVLCGARPTTFDQYRLRAAVLLVFHLGISSRELLDLSVGDVTGTDDGYRIRIRSRDRALVGEPELSVRPTHDEPCPVDALRDWLKARGSTAVEPGAPLFVTSDQRPWTQSTALKELQAAGQQVGIARATWLGLRIGFVRRARQRGMTLAQVQHYTGHRKPRGVKNLERSGRPLVRNRRAG